MQPGRAGAFALVLFVFGMPALAHRLPECVTTLRVNAAENLLEIEHRLHRHDGLRLLALKSALPDTASLDSLALRARLALLVERGFGLRNEMDYGAPALDLELIGAEVDGDYVYVYQQRALPLPEALALQHKVLNALPGALSVDVYVEQGTIRRRIPIARDADWTALPMEFLVGSVMIAR